MSALINRSFPLIRPGAQGPRVYGRGHWSLVTRAGLIEISRESPGNARMHFFMRQVHCVALVVEQQAEAARLDAATAKNLKELGYGGEWAPIRLGDACTKIGIGATPRGGSDVYLQDGSERLQRWIPP